MTSFSNGYTFAFAAVICVVCSIAVSGVSLSLSERQAINRERDLHRNILLSLGLPEDNSVPEGPAIDTLWEQRVEQRFLTPSGQIAGPELDQDGDGDLDNVDLDKAIERARGSDASPAVLGVYVRKDGDNVGAIAIPVTGNGLWGPISGYLALDPAGRSVVGATFFGPKETPGLGAEIQEDPFEDRWLGKQIADDAGKSAPVRVVKGEPETLCPGEVERCVQGVSGATITSRGVDEMVGRALRWYDPYLTTLRGGL